MMFNQLNFIIYKRVMIILFGKGQFAPLYAVQGSSCVLPSCCGNGCHLPCLMSKALTATSVSILESAVLLTVVKTVYWELLL